MRGWWRLAGVCAALLVVLVWVQPEGNSLPWTSPARSPGTAAPAGLLPSAAHEVAAAEKNLASLKVIARPVHDPAYRRAAFGKGWVDTDGNGCNQRDDVLLRDLDPSEPYRTAQQGRCDHDVLAGTWTDPYSGERITLTDAKQPDQAQAVQIDHIVALSVAWRYGAKGWNAERRTAFANDLTNLVASGGASNQAKGGSDAAQWRPVKQAHCGFAVRYIAVKAAYDLPTDTTEREALEDMLGTC